MAKFNKAIQNFGWARIIIFGFLVLLIIIAFTTGMSVSELISSSLVRIGMNGVLVLAILVGIRGGIGLNFGIPIGIVCGLVGAVISMELNLTGIAGMVGAILFSIPFSLIMGYLYGVLLNNTKGDEMTVATYAGFATVSLFSILWILLPVRNPLIVWPIGKGIRTTISLSDFYDKILDQLWAIHIGEVTIPTGTLLFFLGCCLLVWLFFRSKAGIAMIVAGSNPAFARASGINVNRYRIQSTIFSTALSAIGIVIYSQSFGFYQLYQAPLMMGFAAVAAILIGGASIIKASIFNVIIGVVLFQSILTISMPVANQLIDGSLADVIRVLVSNGIIVYALTKAGGDEE
jgi:simple sugar transport system permease protein